jgi:hypothetical protein
LAPKALKTTKNAPGDVGPLALGPQVEPPKTQIPSEIIPKTPQKSTKKAPKHLDYMQKQPPSSKTASKTCQNPLFTPKNAPGDVGPLALGPQVEPPKKHRSHPKSSENTSKTAQNTPKKAPKHLDYMQKQPLDLKNASKFAKKALKTTKHAPGDIRPLALGPQVDPPDDPLPHIVRARGALAARDEGPLGVAVRLLPRRELGGV